MLQTFRGVYRNGKIELLETPEGMSEGPVFVTFLDSQPSDVVPQSISFGMFAAGGQKSTEADFKAAEFQGDGEDGLD